MTEIYLHIVARTFIGGGDDEDAHVLLAGLAHRRPVAAGCTRAGARERANELAQARAHEEKSSTSTNTSKTIRTNAHKTASGGCAQGWLYRP